MKSHYCTVMLFFIGVPGAWAAENKPTLAPEIVAAAERGETDAQFQMSRACLRGEGVPKDVKKAYALMKLAAEQGHAEAIGGLGYFYSVGVAVARDEKQAAEWFRKGAEKNSAKAQLNLAKMLLAGKTTASDPDNSNPNPESLREEGLKWMKKAADLRLPEACLAYGSILYHGEHGSPQDYAKAAPYFQIAAEQGNPDAQNYIGTMKDQGLGVAKDPTAATEWYRKAALQGQIKAQSNLGRVLGPLVKDSETRIEALAWLIIANAQGEVTAEKMLQDVVPGQKNGEMDAAKIKAVELRKQIQKK